MNDKYNLNRFVIAQEGIFDKALSEIKKYYITSPEQEAKLKNVWLHWYGSEKARRESFFPKRK